MLGPLAVGLAPPAGAAEKGAGPVLTQIVVSFLVDVQNLLDIVNSRLGRAPHIGLS